MATAPDQNRQAAHVPRVLFQKVIPAVITLDRADQRATGIPAAKWMTRFQSALRCEVAVPAQSIHRCGGAWQVEQ